MKEWWYTLGARERLMVLIGTAALILILIWALVLDPINSKLKTLRAQVPIKEQTVSWMNTQAQSVAPLVAKAQRERGDTSIPLLTIIEQTAAQAQMRDSIKRIQPGEDNDVQVWLSDAYFDPWIQWVEVLKKKGIEVSSLTVNRGRNDNNTVSIRATFERS